MRDKEGEMAMKNKDGKEYPCVSVCLQCGHGYLFNEASELGQLLLKMERLSKLRNILRKSKRLLKFKSDDPAIYIRQNMLALKLNFWIAALSDVSDISSAKPVTEEQFQEIREHLSKLKDIGLALDGFSEK